jgi:DNA polymerase II
MNGFIVYSTYTTEDNQTTIKLFGRLENGQSFVTLNKFKPYFFIRKSDQSKFNRLLDIQGNDAKSFSGVRKKDEKKALPELKTYIPKPVKLTNFQKEPVLKVEFQTRGELQNAYKKLHKKIPVYEADIRPQYKFLQDKNILSTIKIEGEHESSEKIDRVYHEPKIEPTDFNPKPIILALDIESDSKGNLFCIGLASKENNYKKNFMITSQTLKNTVSCKTEEDCLEKFKAEILKIDPDIITGWNLIDFDFVFLRDLFKKNKIPFDIGRTNDEPRLRIESNFFRSSSIDIPGRQVLDALNLIRDPIIKDSPFIRNTKFNSFTLEDVSQAILNDGKILKGANRHEEIEKLYKTNQQKLADYNLKDCTLVLDILEKTKIISLSLERAQLTGLPLDRLSGSIVSFDSLYIREAHSNGLVSPSLDYKPKEERITGGYVSSINPGIYKNVIVLDFKSLYPSIIRTFNIDPSSFLGKKGKSGGGTIKTPNKVYFKNDEGILPKIIEKLHNAREKAKKENRTLSSHAIKIIMNSFFGVLASPNCRYFSLDIANAITHFGQFLIKLTAKEIEKKGFKTIYSDTDSVFIETNLGKEKANSLGKEIEKEINEFYKKYVKKNYNRESFLELEFEKQYLSLMIPKIRGTEKAAKKRYAGLVEKNGKEVLEITGLEAIRGDWTKAAQEFQVQLLMKLFHSESVEKFIKEYINKIQKGKMDDKLIYRKSIRKELKEYTKTTPPHVKAARKLAKLDSNIIEYYITTDGPEPVQQLKHKIDYSHYLKKQIEPIANQILVLFDKNFDDIIQGTKQAKLF